MPCICINYDKITSFIIESYIHCVLENCNK